MHAPNRTEPWIAMTRRNEEVRIYHSTELMKVSHWSNLGALTPPFDFTPPRKSHVHPYPPPDGFIPQAGAFAPV